MSRYGDDYEGENFPGESHLWEANAERALKGKRGRKALADLREALLALPEHRLIEGALCTVNPEKRLGHLSAETWAYRDLGERIEDGGGAGVCAVGALLWHRKVRAGMDPAEAFDSLPTMPDSDYDLHDTARLAVRDAGLVYSLAWNLAYRNDETYECRTPEQRWQAFIDWIDAELATVTA